MKSRALSLVLSGLLMCAASAFAQQGTTEVKGKVVDSQSAAVPGATVVAKNQATGMFRETVSGTDGTYFVGGLAPGIYEISAELQGFKKLGLRDIRLEIGKTTTLDLQLAVGGIEEVVSVSAESPLVDVTTKEVGGNIGGGELIDLPSINRNFIGFIGLLPGIVPSITALRPEVAAQFIAAKTSLMARGFAPDVAQFLAIAIVCPTILTGSPNEDQHDN
jgi:hypothetical protein